MTEAASQITAHPLSVPRRPGSVGLPVGVELRIVRQADPVGSPLEAPEFHIGHVEIRGASVVRGLRRWHACRPLQPDGWLRTGDLGHRDADGFLYLDARTDDVINRGGEKMLPREIEEAIAADAMIASVAVVGRDDPELGQVPVAYVVLRAAAGDDGATTCLSPRRSRGGRSDQEDPGARPRARQATGRALCGGEDAGRPDGQGQATPAGQPRGTRPVHLRPAVTTVESPLSPARPLRVPASGSITSTPCGRSSRRAWCRRTPSCSSLPSRRD